MTPQDMLADAERTVAAARPIAVKIQALVDDSTAEETVALTAIMGALCVRMARNASERAKLAVGAMVMARVMPGQVLELYDNPEARKLWE